MNIHEYGTGNARCIVLIHPSLVMWDYFEYVIPLLENDFHLIIPALPGYDPEKKSDFSSVETIARQLADQLLLKGITEVECMYGCSMGGSIVLRFLQDGLVPVHCAVADGAITPYQLPWLLTRFIALKDFLLIEAGKVGGVRLLEKAFATDEYSDEDLQYVADVLNMISAKTIWNTFDSCNNYAMPSPEQIRCGQLEYWCTGKEKKERKADIAWMKQHLPQTRFRFFENIGHAGMTLLEPELFAREIRRIIRESDTSGS